VENNFPGKPLAGRKKQNRVVSVFDRSHAHPNIARMPLRSLAVDFNSFFASCEQQERPELRGRPLGIVPVIADTTCCIAASYAAKIRGVKVGTGIAEARALCPDIQLVQQRPAVYIGYSRRLRDIIESCLHISETRSIDEVECDLTATFAPREKALAVAREIKHRIAREVGPCLTSSIGIAPNWMLAKMATDLQKPDGLVVLEDADLPQRLLGLKLQDFLGIGAHMEIRLRARGIDTAAKLYAAPKAVLRGVWGGIEGERMHARLRGAAIPLPVEKNQTIGHSHVLPPYLRTVPKSHAVLHRLVQKAAMRLRHIGHYAGALVLALDYYDDIHWSDELRFNETQDTLQFTLALNRLWARRPAALQRRAPFRVGVVLTRLLPMSGHTPDLFHHDRDDARERLHHAVDTLNQTFGHGSVYFGGAHGVQEAAPMRISYTCIPEPELEEIDPKRQRRLRPKKPQPAAWSEDN
jgi:DNA polymerase-4